jgi:hypothetical protein
MIKTTIKIKAKKFERKENRHNEYERPKWRPKTVFLS